MSDEDRLLYAEDVARLRGIGVRQARDYLRELETRYGREVVGTVRGRRGPRRYTTAAALAKIGPGHIDRARGVESRLNDLESGLASVEREVAEIRRLVQGTEDALPSSRSAGR